MRVLIVDDHERVRRGVREVLSRTLRAEVCGEAGSAAEALQKIQEESWDVVLLDLSLPDRGGLETLHELRRLRADVPVVVMSMHPESQYGAVARAAGAAAYLPKGSDPEVIAAAVRSALGMTDSADGEAPAAMRAGTGAREEARAGLARFIHDDLVQALAAVKISLQLARSAGDPAEMQRHVSEGMAGVDRAIASARQLSARLDLEDPEAAP